METLRLTVALDLTELDQKVLEYTSFLCRSLPVDKIYFLHVTETLDIPPEFIRDHPDAEPMDESIENHMRQAVQAHFTSQRSIEFEYEAVEGKVLASILHQTKIKLSDLLVVGKRASHKEEAFVAEKLARHALCSVLFVPADFSLDIQNILVPVDYSAHSALAVESACRISDAIDGDTLHLLNFFDVPKQYYKLGKSYEQAAEDMKAYAKEGYAKFKASLNLGDNEIQPHFVDSHNKNKTTLIQEHLKAFDCQLLVMGSKGRTNLSAIFLGSLTEKLIKADLGVPVLVIKKRNENMGLIDAILN